MKTLSFDPIRADVAITEKEKSAALHANALLHNGQGAGNDFLGWVGLPSALDEEELQAIETEAARLRDLAEVILCIGIGGSYLGARAVYEALSDPFNLLYEHPANPILLFVGQNLSEDYLSARSRREPVDRGHRDLQVGHHDRAGHCLPADPQRNRTPLRT